MIDDAVRDFVSNLCLQIVEMIYSYCENINVFGVTVRSLGLFNNTD